MTDYAVFGNPAEHSLSPQMHLIFGTQVARTLSYGKYTIESDDFEQKVRAFFADGGIGLNITLPFKERAFCLCDSTSERAAEARAVNTLWHNNGQLCGDNTDGAGIINDLTQRLGWIISNSNLLILGAGGSVRGIVHSLLQAKPKQCTIANRSPDRAKKIITGCADIYPQIKLLACGLEQLDCKYDYIINATNISLSQDNIQFATRIINRTAACYDLAYSITGLTRFCQWAQNHGCRRTSDGLGMLVEQGAESFRIWHGIKPDTKGIEEQLRSTVITCPKSDSRASPS